MIYLDNAATTLKKPSSVAAAVASAMRSCSSAGRGGHTAAQKASEVLFKCREEAAGLFGVRNPENIIFTHNATHSLNIAIKALVRPGAAVLTSGLEHNAVARPLHALRGFGISSQRVETPLFEPEKALESFKEALKKKVDVIVCIHVSNVFGYLLPIEEIISLANGIPVIVDAAQSAGSIPINAAAHPNTYWCMPGHKGLYGPQGTGLLIVPETGSKLKTLLEGGTGSRSTSLDMPDYIPDRFEAGTHNVPGIAGLCEGMKFVKKTGEAEIGEKARRLIQHAGEGLRSLPGIRVYSHPRHQTGVVSFVIDGKDGEWILSKLPEFCLRAGLHCAPAAHQTAGTLSTGTIRLSVSSFTQKSEIDDFIYSLSRVIKQ